MDNESSSPKAVITGASSGIGKSIAKKFFEAGFEIAMGDIQVPDQLSGHFWQVDFVDKEEVETFIEEIKETIGCPDVLVCNAGRGIHERLTEGNPDRWEEIFRLNVFSTFRLIRALVPEMEKNKRGDVVFISSVSADHPYPYGGIYTATKAAVDQLAETLRLEVQPHVRITVIHPGVVKTCFFENMIGGSHNPEDIGWGHLEACQVADAVLYAVSQPRDIMLNDIVLRPAAQPM